MSRRDSATNSSPAQAGVRAAGLLGETCRSALESRSSLQLEVVRDAALDLKRQLEVLASSTEFEEVSPDLLAESVARCADTANLSACAIPELPEDMAPAAISATHLAVEAIRHIYPLIEAVAGKLEGERAEYALRDARGSMWRADLVVRQIEETSPDKY